MASAAWTATRHDDEVRIDLTESASIEQADTQAIIGAIEEYITQDGVTSFRLGGPTLEAHPLPDYLTNLIRDLTGFVEGRGLHFYFGPL